MRRFFLFVIFINVSYYCLAQFSGQGTGTERDPYLVSNADELFEVRNDMNAYYKLVNDIDLRVWLDEESPRLGWNPIGSYTTPFRGHFDGNKKSIIGMYINRDTEDCIGFFGCTVDADIENLSLINPMVNGNNYVAAIVGRYCYSISSFNTSKISNVVVICGKISSNNSDCGSIAGCIEPYPNDIKEFREYGNSHNKSIYVKGCYSSSYLESTNKCAGICGSVACGQLFYDKNYGSPVHSQSYNVYFQDNSFDGGIKAGAGCAGILGDIKSLSETYQENGRTATKRLEPHVGIWRNIISGSLYTTSNWAEGIVYGCLPQYVSYISVSNNFCLADTLSSQTNSVHRISAHGYPDNYAYNKTITIIRGTEESVTDDDSNGYSYGSSTLHRKSTYSGAGFDFISQWNIIEGETFPFNIGQSMLPVVTKFESGSKGILEGTSPEDGKIFVIANQKLYTTNAIDKTWKLTLGKIGEGEVAKISFKNDVNHPSIIVSSVAEASIITPTVLCGDSNSDGVVDAADVVGTINYILGKPSSSFNQQNADVNEDGQILVDDAVGTVNVIMNNQ